MNEQDFLAFMRQDLSLWSFDTTGYATESQAISEWPNRETSDREAQVGYGVQGIPRLYGQLHERTGVTTITNFTNTPFGISVCIQIANTEEYIDGQLAGNLGEVLIR